MENSLNQLADYVLASRKQGYPDDAIKTALASKGWSEADIAEAIGSADSEVNQTTTPPQSTSYTLTKKPKLNSPYSVLLSFVLFFALLILVNQVLSDVSKYFEDEKSTELIFNAFIVVGFLLIAFALHFSLDKYNNKYLIISKPYYLVSGLLLLKLLWDTSFFILDQETVFGVYVVLIMVVVVLTGMILFVQRYLKK